MRIRWTVAAAADLENVKNYLQRALSAFRRTDRADNLAAYSFA
jgi:hypothetical protein